MTELDICNDGNLPLVDKQYNSHLEIVSRLLEIDEKRSGMKRFLFIGVDPKFIDIKLATSTGWDLNRVKVAVVLASKSEVIADFIVRSVI